MKNLIAVTLLVGAVGGCGRFGGAPKTDEDKTLYALGMIIGRNLSDFNLTPRELDIVKAGMTDTVQKKKTSVDIETWGPKVDALHTSRRQARGALEKKQGQAAVENAAREPGAVKTPAGAIVRTVKPGTGATPQPTDRVEVHTGDRPRVRDGLEGGLQLPWGDELQHEPERARRGHDNRGGAPPIGEIVAVRSKRADERDEDEPHDEHRAGDDGHRVCTR